MNIDKDSAVLLPCPFCGSANIDPEGWGSENSSGPACDDCGASAGSTVASTPEENIEAWNKRQPTQSDALKAAGAAIRGLLDITSEYNLDSEQAGRAYAALHDIGTALQEQSK
jgi:Lar family restriction alleviation protein